MKAGNPLESIEPLREEKPEAVMRLCRLVFTS